MVKKVQRGQGGRPLGSTTRRGDAKPKTKKPVTPGPVKGIGPVKDAATYGKHLDSVQATKNAARSKARKEAFEKASAILDGAGKAASALSDKGLSLNQSASSVRSGASTGAKTTDPWRSFTTESGSVNDNN